jgi:hypothetical protein
MKVSELITQLQDIIIAAYWSQDDFPEDVDWPAAVETIDRKMDWSDAHEQMCDLLTIPREL